MENALSHIFVLGPRGDPILSRDLRGDIKCLLAGTIDAFYQYVTHRSASGLDHTLPVFNVNGNNYIYLKRGGMYFVCVTRFNISPNLAIEFLVRLLQLFKDFCGVLSEESFRANFILLYELLDEVLDGGYIQTTTTADLRYAIHSEPVILLDTARRTTARGKVLAPNSAMKPITMAQIGRNDLLAAPPAAGGRKGGEIFIDVVERLSAVFSCSSVGGGTFNSNGGDLVNAMVEGSIVMKSYLEGRTMVWLSLPSDLAIQGGRWGGSSSSSSSSQSSSAASDGTFLRLDDANFHGCVNTDELESRRFLTLEPPLGEFVCMNYRVTSKEALGAMPFRVYPTLVETSDPCRLEFTLNVRCEGLPARLYAADVEVRFPVPANSLAVWPSVARDSLTEAFHQAARGQGGPAAAKIPTQRAKMDHTVEYLAGKKEVVWCIKRFPGGGTDATLKCRISLATPPPTSAFRKSLGPIAMTFEVPDHNLTRLRISDCKVQNGAAVWCRYIVNSLSYTSRIF